MNIKQRRSEKKKEELRRLSQADGNKFCFACGVRGTLYIVTNFHIFVCSSCGATHRSLQHKVKGISMSEFTDEEVTCAMVCGNIRAKEVWLAHFTRVHPKQGNDTAVREFLTNTFERKVYFDRGAFTQLQRDIEAALNPSESSAELPRTQLKSPPHPQAQTQSLVVQVPMPATNAIQKQPLQQSQPPQQPQQAHSVAAAESAPALQSNTAPSHSVFDDLFSAAPPAAAAVTTTPAPPPPTVPPSNASIVSDLFTTPLPQAPVGGQPPQQQHLGDYPPQVPQQPFMQPSVPMGYGGGGSTSPMYLHAPQHVQGTFPAQYQQPPPGGYQQQPPGGYQQQYAPQPQSMQYPPTMAAYNLAPQTPNYMSCGMVTGSAPMQAATYQAPLMNQQPYYPSQSQGNINYFAAPPQGNTWATSPPHIPKEKPERNPSNTDRAFASLDPFGGK